MHYCEKCKKTQNESEFYSSNNTEKYADGRLHQCKKCITMHVDNWDPNTYLWIIQECDVPEDYFGQINSSPEDESIVTDLTDEDRTYLRLKWGKSYKPEEWVRLEQLYEEMMNSYDIQTAGHIDTLILLCKTSLKANQLLDIADKEGKKKMMKMYDQLMKSGKFTAAQNKAEQGEYVDSVGELVAICEKDGFIPKYYVDGPQDKVDRVIQDMQQYTHDLITEEVGLGPLIERAIQQMEEEKDSLLKNTGEIDENKEEEELFDYKTDAVLKDVDFAEFTEFEEEQEELNDEVLKELIDT